MLRLLWNQRHRIFRGIRHAQAAMGDALARLPLPISAKLVIADLTFLACESFILHTESYRKWRAQRIGRGRIHALLKSPPTGDFEGYAPIAPTNEEWSRVTPLRVEGAEVDIVVPVYNGFATTLRCLHSVLSSRNATPFELIVINDASTDAALVAMLYELAGRDLFTLLENESNLGFVATVNRGMQLHSQRDVVLLNADAQVCGDWLDRLRAQAHSGTKTGSVTPLSNHAGICSYPVILRNNPPMEDADALAAAANAGRSCELPTAVGFCMYIPRPCLEAVGYFDEERFGRGYGEENDFCLRATKLGYVHLLAGDVYVLHAGGASFGKEKATREKAAWKLLKKRYPDYARRVATFVAEDPPLSLRRGLDLARMAQKQRGRNVLTVCHALGGGTEKHLQERREALQNQEQAGVFLLSPAPGQPGLMQLRHHDIPPSPNLVFSLNEEHEALSAALQKLGVSRIEVHHLLGFPEGTAEFLGALARRLDAGYEVRLHDYYFFCPRINLTTENDAYCGEPDLAGCEACIATRSSHAGAAPVWLWRERWGRFLREAQRVVAPDTEVATRFTRHFPGLRIDVVPHEKHLRGGADLRRPFESGQTLRIGLLGALSALKGAKVVQALLEDAETRHLPIEYVLIGYSDYPPLAQSRPRWRITGPYRDEELEGLLRECHPHLLLFPSIWPETYHYALSHAFRHNIPPAAFDLGAQSSRIRAQGLGWTLPLALADDAAALGDRLLALAKEAPEHRKREFPKEATLNPIFRESTDGEGQLNPYAYETRNELEGE